MRGQIAARPGPCSRWAAAPLTQPDRAPCTPGLLPGPRAAALRAQSCAGCQRQRQAGSAPRARGAAGPLPPTVPSTLRPERPWHLLPFPAPAADEEVMHVGRRVYVSNLAWRTSWQDLKDK